MQFFRVLKSLSPRDNLQIANKFFTSSYQLAEQSTPRKPFPSARTNTSNTVGTVNEFKSGDGGTTIEHYPLGARKFLYVRKFQDRLTVQIREFFVPKIMQTTPEDQLKFEDLRPSQRGVALTPYQWRELKALIQRIDKDLQSTAPAPPPAAAPAQN